MLLTRKLPRFLTGILGIICLIASTGCVFRPTKEIEIVRVSISRHPEEIEGVFWIATNTPIPAILEGTEIKVEKDFGGYYLVHKSDLAELIRLLEKNK